MEALWVSITSGFLLACLVGILASALFLVTSNRFKLSELLSRRDTTHPHGRLSVAVRAFSVRNANGPRSLRLPAMQDGAFGQTIPQTRHRDGCRPGIRYPSRRRIVSQPGVFDTVPQIAVVIFGELSVTDHTGVVAMQ